MSKYLKSVQAGKCPNPKTKSFEVVREWVSDPMCVCKLSFFCALAKPIECFLTAYQTDKPMIFFVAKNLELLIRNLMKKFIRTKVVDANTVAKLLKIYWNDKTVLKSSKYIDVGFRAERILSECLESKTISERPLLEFRMECRETYIKVVSKLKDKSPITYSLVRNLKCLDPQSIVQKVISKLKDKSPISYSLFRNLKCLDPQSIVQKKGSIQFGVVLNHLVDAGHLDTRDCDDVKSLFEEFTSDDAVVSRCREFDKMNDRVDTLYYDVVGQCPKYLQLWNVLKTLLLLSHGQASAESFFFDKQMCICGQY